MTLPAILIALGIIVLWLWIFLLDNAIKPEHKRPINLVIFVVVTVWLVVELVRHYL